MLITHSCVEEVFFSTDLIIIIIIVAVAVIIIIVVVIFIIIMMMIIIINLFYVDKDLNILVSKIFNRGYTGEVIRIKVNRT